MPTSDGKPTLGEFLLEVSEQFGEDGSSWTDEAKRMFREAAALLAEPKSPAGEELLERAKWHEASSLRLNIEYAADLRAWAATLVKLAAAEAKLAAARALLPKWRKWISEAPKAKWAQSKAQCADELAAALGERPARSEDPETLAALVAGLRGLRDKVRKDGCRGTGGLTKGCCGNGTALQTANDIDALLSAHGFGEDVQQAAQEDDPCARPVE